MRVYVRNCSCLRRKISIAWKGPIFCCYCKVKFPTIANEWEFSPKARRMVLNLTTGQTRCAELFAHIDCSRAADVARKLFFILIS